MFLNQQNFLQFKEIFSFTVHQRNVSLIKKKLFSGCTTYNLFSALQFFSWGIGIMCCNEHEQLAYRICRQESQHRLRIGFEWRFLQTRDTTVFVLQSHNWGINVFLFVRWTVALRDRNKFLAVGIFRKYIPKLRKSLIFWKKIVSFRLFYYSIWISKNSNEWKSVTYFWLCNQAFSTNISFKWLPVWKNFMAVYFLIWPRSGNV